MCVPRGVEGDECHPFSHKVRRNVMSIIFERHSLSYTHTPSTPHLFGEIQIVSCAGSLAEALENLLITAEAIDLLHSELGDQSHTSH